MNDPVNQARETVTVRLRDRGYDIEIDRGNLDSVGPFLASRRDATHAVIITDENVDPYYGDRVAESLRQVGLRDDRLVVPAGERSKSISASADLWDRMLGCGADRHSIVVAVGGGVVGDLAGFIAATFARGIPLLQVPTSLLAQVDSSVGGKVGINLPQAKNLIGAFWQPVGVLIDTDVLTTLPDREYRAGLAEVVKYGVILDADFFAFLEANTEGINRRESSVLRGLIARCCQLKANVVEQDEHETTGLRAVLNYGHTFCHALESATGYGQLLHGEAVAIGMLCASRLAERRGRIGKDVTRRQKALLEQFALPTRFPSVSHDELVRLMRHDKKAASGALVFVLPSAWGHAELVTGVDESEVRAVLSEMTDEEAV